LLVREIFAAAGGDRDDWDSYDRVMVEQRRADYQTRLRLFQRSVSEKMAV
jgi:hypothetical protein